MPAASRRANLWCLFQCSGRKQKRSRLPRRDTLLAWLVPLSLGGGSLDNDLCFGREPK